MNWHVPVLESSSDPRIAWTALEFSIKKSSLNQLSLCMMRWRSFFIFCVSSYQHSKLIVCCNFPFFLVACFGGFSATHSLVYVLWIQLTPFAYAIFIFFAFYAQVLSGEYRLSAISATPDSASGLMFLPSYIDVAVKGPLLNIKFSQVNFLKWYGYLFFHKI